MTLKIKSTNYKKTKMIHLLISFRNSNLEILVLHFIFYSQGLRKLFYDGSGGRRGKEGGLSNNVDHPGWLTIKN